jgi:hypothetical protein
MIRDAILALGIVLSSASQLRIPGLPIGPGEMVLAAWLCLTFLALLVDDTPRARPGLAPLATFWIGFAVAMSLGTFVGLLTGRFSDFGDFTHDTIAYALMAAVSCFAAAGPHAAAALRRTAWFCLLFWNGMLALEVVRALGGPALLPVDPWYWDRFRGWSENPNQLALYNAVIVPLAVHLALTSRGARAGAAWAGAVLPFVVGRMTKSDTFVVAMFATFAILAGLRLRLWLTAPEHRTGLRFAAAVVLLLAVGPLALALAPYRVAAANDAESIALSLAKDKGGAATTRTAELRLSLWGQALVLGLESGSLGLGPGPHLDRPTIVGSDRLPAPFEAHSTILDSYMQGGILVVVLLVALIAGTAALAFRMRLDGLVALLAALSVFGISHFILRHPVVWLALVLCLVTAASRARAAAVPGRR